MLGTLKCIVSIHFPIIKHFVPILHTEQTQRPKEVQFLDQGHPGGLRGPGSSSCRRRPSALGPLKMKMGLMIVRLTLVASCLLLSVESPSRYLIFTANRWSREGCGS